MNGSVSRDEIASALAEHLGVVVEGEGPGTGPVQAACLIHHANGGATEVELHGLFAQRGGPVWGDAAKMAELLDVIATRHARGIAGGGQQQFQIAIVRSGKACGFIPFTRVGSPVVAGPGGLSTEGPTGVGMTSQGMRLLEIHSQGNFQLTGALMTASMNMLDKISARLDAAEARADARAQTIATMIVQFIQMSTNAQLRALGIEAARRLLPLAPGYIAMVAGGDSAAAADTAQQSIFDALVENYSGEQLQQMLAQMASGEGGSAVSAIAADQLVKAKRRKETRDRATKSLVDASPATTYADGEADAGGDVIRQALRAIQAETPQPALPNGHAKGAPPKALPKTEAKREAPDGRPATSRGDDLLDTMLATVSDSEIEMLATMMAAKRPDQPDLAQRIRDRFAAVKGGQ